MFLNRAIDRYLFAIELKTLLLFKRSDFCLHLLYSHCGVNQLSSIYRQVIFISVLLQFMHIIIILIGLNRYATIHSMIS